MDSEEDRIRSLWPDLEKHWRRLVTSDDELPMAKACLCRRSIPHESVLKVIDPALYRKVLNSMRNEIESRTPLFFKAPSAVTVPPKKSGNGWASGSTPRGPA